MCFTHGKALKQGALQDSSCVPLYLRQTLTMVKPSPKGSRDLQHNTMTQGKVHTPLLSNLYPNVLVQLEVGGCLPQVWSSIVVTFFCSKPQMNRWRFQHNFLHEHLSLGLIYEPNLNPCMSRLHLFLCTYIHFWFTQVQIISQFSFGQLALQGTNVQNLKQHDVKML